MPKKMMHVAQWWTVTLLQHCCKYRNVPHPYPGHPHPAPSPISCWHPHLLHHPSPLTFTPAPLIPGPFPWPEPSRPIHCHLSAPIPSHLRPLTPSHRCPHPSPLTPITPPSTPQPLAPVTWLTHKERNTECKLVPRSQSSIHVIDLISAPAEPCPTLLLPTPNTLQNDAPLRTSALAS